MTSVQNNTPMPLSDPIARKRRPQFVQQKREDPLEGLLTEPWVEFLNGLVTTQEAAPARVETVSLVAQSASVAATDMTGGTLSSGLYRITYYAEITQAATTSSSLTVTFDWLSNTGLKSDTFAAITGNTTDTHQPESILIRIDANSPVRYTLTYASVGATPMLYSFYAVIEEVLA